MRVRLRSRRPLIPKTRAEGRLAQGKAGLFPQFGKAVRKADGNSGLAFAGRRRGDRRYKDKPARLEFLQFFK